MRTALISLCFSDLLSCWMRRPAYTRTFPFGPAANEKENVTLHGKHHPSQTPRAKLHSNCTGAVHHASYTQPAHDPERSNHTTPRHPANLKNHPEYINMKRFKVNSSFNIPNTNTEHNNASAQNKSTSNIPYQKINHQ